MQSMSPSLAVAVRCVNEHLSSYTELSYGLRSVDSDGCRLLRRQMSILFTPTLVTSNLLGSTGRIQWNLLMYIQSNEGNVSLKGSFAASSFRLRAP